MQIVLFENSNLGLYRKDDSVTIKKADIIQLPKLEKPSRYSKSKQVDKEYSFGW